MRDFQEIIFYSIDLFSFRNDTSQMVNISQRKSIQIGKQLSPIPLQAPVNDISAHERKDSQIDFANLTVDINQTDKQILVEVSTPLSKIESASQISNISKDECVVIDDDSFMSRNNTRLTRNSFNTTMSSSKCNKSSKSFDDDNIEILTTPVVSRLSFGHQATPIGKIRLRKIGPKTESPDLDISEDETYEIVVVNKSQQMCEEHSNAMGMMQQFEETTSAKNSAIASKTTATAHPFPLSPRIILHRINSLDEYQQSISTQPTPVVTSVNKKRIERKAKVVRTKKGMLNDDMLCIRRALSTS